MSDAKHYTIGKPSDIPKLENLLCGKIDMKVRGHLVGYGLNPGDTHFIDAHSESIVEQLGSQKKNVSVA